MIVLTIIEEISGESRIVDLPALFLPIKVVKASISILVLFCVATKIFNNYCLEFQTTPPVYLNEIGSKHIVHAREQGQT